MRPQEWAERERVLWEAADARIMANRAATEAGEALHGLERIRHTRPQLLRHAAADAWLMAHPEAPSLPNEFAARLPAARGKVALAAHGTEAMRQALAQLEAEIAAIVTDDTLLARAEAIAALGLPAEADPANPPAISRPARRVAPTDRKGGWTGRGAGRPAAPDGGSAVVSAIAASRLSGCGGPASMSKAPAILGHTWHQRTRSPFVMLKGWLVQPGAMAAQTMARASRPASVIW